jgi:hypothetical protein
VQDCGDATLRRICRSAGSRSYPGCPKASDRSSMNARESERFCPSSPPLKRRVLGSNARFAAFPRLLPPHPPAPFSHKGRRGSLGVLMPETEDGAQGLPQKPTPVSSSPHPPSPTLGADRTGVSHACCFLRLRPAGAHACRPGRCSAPGWRRVGRTANTRSTNLVHRSGPTPR